MPAEVEAKLRATNLGVLAALAEAPTLGEAHLGPAHTFDEVDLYLDTPDGRLAAARWACRLRDRGDGPYVSLKGPAAAVSADGVHSRPEHEGPATASLDPSTWPPSEARDLLLDLSGRATLVERVRLLQRRTERAVTIRDRHVGTLSLDEVRVGRGERVLDGTLHVVELELAGDDDASVAELDRLAAALAMCPGLEPDPTTKLAHALAALGDGT